MRWPVDLRNQFVNRSSNKLSVIVVDPRGYTPPYDYSLCEALSQNNCDVLLACTQLGEVQWNFNASFPVWHEFYNRNTHVSHNSAFLGRAAEGIRHTLGLRRLAAMARRVRPDIIHFQWLPLPALDQFCLASLRRQAKLVLTLHNTTLLHGVVSRWRGLGFITALKQFDAVVVHTEFSKRKILEQGWMKEEKIHVVPHGVLQYYSSIETECGDAEPTRNLLFFGNLHAYKGVDILLRAFARLSAKSTHNTRLTIAGRPEMDTQPLRALARQLEIEDRVDWMLRPITEAEVPALFRSATAVVLPYREIDQSGVLMTAIAFGKPILATRVGGIPETIQDGIHGYLVPPEDPDSLAVAADRLLADAEARNRMEMAVRDLRNGSLSWRNIASRTVGLYRNLLDIGWNEERSTQSLAFPVVESGTNAR